MPEPENNEPIYNSVYRFGVDEKRRLQIPAKWRPVAETTFTLILWRNGWQPDACLLALPPRLARTFVDKMTALSFSDANAEALRRFLGEKSDTVIVDKAGRICLPDAMAKAAGIGKEALLNGMFDRFQIWNPERYEATRPAVDNLAANAFQLI
jgi:MraZ protein